MAGLCARPRFACQRWLRNMCFSKQSTGVGPTRSSSGMMTISTCLGTSQRTPRCCSTPSGRIRNWCGRFMVVAQNWSRLAADSGLPLRCGEICTAGLQGFIPSARADFDQAHLSAWRRYGGEPGRPEPPSFVYGWGRAKHCSSVMTSPDDTSWYSRHQMTKSGRVEQLVVMDEQTQANL